MKVYYVAGPYRAETEEGIRGNIERASEAALELWRQGHAVICPHMNSAMFPEDEGIDYVAGDLEIMERLRPNVDVIYMLRGWERSLGAREELAFAERHGLLVEYQQPTLPGMEGR